MDDKTYVISVADAPEQVLPAECEATNAESGATLDEINAKLDLLLASQGIEPNKEVVE